MAKPKPFGWVFTPRIKNANTLEVKPTPIVFCEDCEEYKEWRDGEKICLRLGSYWGNTKPTDFCSFGKPREGFTPMQFEDARKRLYMEVSGDE